MPIEIRELVIKATIAENSSATAASATGGTGGGATDDASVQKIVDQVLSKIRNKNER
jgi:hypothetical protein